MEVLKKMKTETLLRLIVPVALLILMGIVFLSGSNLFAEEPTPRNLWDVPRSQLEGSYVTVEVDWIYVNYAYTEQYKDNKPTGKITEREYVIDANENDYCALILDGDLMEKAEALLQECTSYRAGTTSSITQTFTVTGWVKALPSDSKSLYYDAFDYYTRSAEEKETILALYLSPADYAIEPVMLVLAIVFIGSAIVLLYLALTGWYQRQISEKVKNSGYPVEKYDEFLRYMYQNVPAMAGVRIESGFLLLRTEFSHFLYDSSDLVWAYKKVTTRRLYGIVPMGKTYSLVLKTADGKEKAINMKEANVKALLEKIIVQFPTCALGYDANLESLYRKDPNALRQIGQSQRSGQNA